MKKSLIILIAILILAAAAYYWATQNRAIAPTDGTANLGESQNQSAENQPATTTPQTPTTSAGSGLGADVSVKVGNNATGTFSAGEEMDGGPDIQVKAIDYDGTKFTPSTVDIKVNDYVIFYNKSSVDFWPASAPHPSHTNYPEFDAKKPIAPGGTFKFQFTKEGSWGFHDHLNPTVFGKVNVSK